MKKVFCKSWFARNFLMKSYHTITIGPFVFSRLQGLPQYVLNHECVHARQWIELAFVSFFLLWLGLLIFDYSPWWLLLSVVVFYLWYGVEYMIRRIIGLFGRKVDDAQGKAYRNVLFEREARCAENDCHYLENSGYFNWLHC